jgi:hypothetical protein
MRRSSRLETAESPISAGERDSNSPDSRNGIVPIGVRCDQQDKGLPRHGPGIAGSHCVSVANAAQTIDMARM